MEIEKVKNIIDLNLIDKEIVRVTYSDSTSETIETQPLINTVNKLRGEVLEIVKCLNTINSINSNACARSLEESIYIYM